MSPALEDLRNLLSDIQISYLDLDSAGESLGIGLIDYLGQESRVTAEGLYQLSISRVPDDKPSFTILSCTLVELADVQIENHIPGYAITYVRWREEIQRGIHLRLEGDVVVDLTCRSIRFG